MSPLEAENQKLDKFKLGPIKYDVNSLYMWFHTYMEIASSVKDWKKIWVHNGVYKKCFEDLLNGIKSPILVLEKLNVNTISQDSSLKC